MVFKPHSHVPQKILPFLFLSPLLLKLPQVHQWITQYECPGNNGGFKWKKPWCEPKVIDIKDINFNVVEEVQEI